MHLQTSDFAEEVQVLAAALRPMRDAQWTRPTQFKQWTPEHILRHLHCWNEAADWAVHAPEAFRQRLASSREHTGQGGSMRDFERQMVDVSGQALLERWQAFALDMAQRWQGLDARQRVDWAGPPMSVRSSMTARQMETWAHGQAIFDMLGQDRPESGRLRNIVVLGNNTYGWTFKNRKEEPPGPMPRLKLTAPSGAIWEYGEGEDLIEGSASEFCQVVTQCRNIGDTSLKVSGPVATRWMAIAQCFAGPPQDPPPAGARHKA